jgi:hypothetical protein
MSVRYSGLRIFLKTLQSFRWQQKLDTLIPAD